MGVAFMDPVISRNAWFCTLSNVYIADLDADDSVVDPYSRCGRIVPIYTFLNTVSAAPHWVPAIFQIFVVSWSRILAVVAYSSVLHMTKSSAYIAHFTGDGNVLIRSLMNTMKSVGDILVVPHV